MTVEDLFKVIGYRADIKLISSFNGKMRAKTDKKAKEFYSYEVAGIAPKIKVNKEKYGGNDYATPYLEIHIRDYNDWKGEEIF